MITVEYRGPLGRRQALSTPPPSRLNGRRSCGAPWPRPTDL